MKPQSLIVNYNGPVSYTKTQLLKAGRKVSQFIGRSFNTVASLFGKSNANATEGQTQNQNQIKAPKRRRPFSRSSYLILKNQNSNQQTLQLPKQKHQNNQEKIIREVSFPPSDLPKSDEKRIADASTQVYTYQSTRSPSFMDCLYLSPDINIHVQEELESQVEFEYKSNKPDTTKSSIEEQDQEIERLQSQYQNGSKRIKRQISCPIETTVQIQKKKLILTEEDYLSKDYPQMVVKIINKRDKKRMEEAQQIRANYEKRMNKPKKIQIVREIKQARRLMREVRSRQQDVKIRFDLYRIQRKKKIKSSLKIQKVNQLNLEIKRPAPIITVVQQQAPIPKVILQEQQSSPKAVLQEQITQPKVIVQQETVPKKVVQQQLREPKITVKKQVPDKGQHQQRKVQAQQTIKETTFKVPIQPKKEEKKVQEKKKEKKEEKKEEKKDDKPKCNNPFKIAKPREIDNEEVIKFRKQAQNKLFKNFSSQKIKEIHNEILKNIQKKEQKISIDKPVQQVPQKPLPQAPEKQIIAKIKNTPRQQTVQTVQLVNKPLDRLRSISYKQSEKPKEIKQILKPQLQIVSESKQFQQIATKDIPIVQNVKKQEIKTPIIQAQHNQTVVQQQPQNAIPKSNPFLSTAPSVRLTINDILTKNPQFAIFQKSEPIPKTSVAPVCQTQSVASLFMPNNSSSNPFIFNQQQAEPQQSYAYSNNNPFAFASNNSYYEQPQVQVQNQDSNNYQNYEQNLEKQYQQDYNNHHSQDYNHYQQQQEYNNQDNNVNQGYNLNEYYNNNNMNHSYNMNQDQSYMMHQNQGYSIEQNQSYSIDQNQGYFTNQGQNYSTNQDQHYSMNQGYHNNQAYNTSQNYYNFNQDYGTNQYQYDNQNNQIQMSYQPGTFADPVFSRNLFEAAPRADQPVPGFLFESMASTNNYNSRNNTKSGGSARNKKPKDIRL